VATAVMRYIYIIGCNTLVLQGKKTCTFKFLIVDRLSLFAILFLSFFFFSMENDFLTISSLSFKRLLQRTELSCSFRILLPLFHFCSPSRVHQATKAAPDSATLFDLTWGYAHDGDASSDSHAVCDWSAVEAGTAAMPACVKGTCAGINEGDDGEEVSDDEDEA